VPTTDDRLQTLDFEGLQIRYDERVLTPRPWTAAQSRWAAELTADAGAGPILEVCAGVGHIGLLAARLSGRSLVAVDIDPIAARFLRDNAANAGIEVDLRVGSMLGCLAVDERFGVVIADPPWVRAADVGQFPQDPPPAINGGEDGLDLVRMCVQVIDGHLAPGGAAVLQVGPGEQADRAVEIVRGSGDLEVAEVRSFDRGSLLRIDRKP
jgi:methylase of polypeptide subunit release factors